MTKKAQSQPAPAIEAHPIPAAVCLLSGGMDSTTLAYLLQKQEKMSVIALGVNYGQRHVRELESAVKVAAALKIPFYQVDIPGVGALVGGSSLTDESIPVPHGHYADESMKITVVPNRNAIMLSIAFGFAASIKATRVGAAIHAGDHPIYPDCRPEFAFAFDLMIHHALDGIVDPIPYLFTPFIDISKAEIVKIGHKLHVPYELTWSCYEGGEVHCGECGTCVERREAFELAGVRDPTIYAK